MRINSFVGICFLCLLLCGCSNKENISWEDYSTDVEKVDDGLEELETKARVDTTSDEHPIVSKDEYFIYICGAVLYPNVYQVPKGTRLFEVLNLAGGFCENADQSYLNLAKELEDGEQIYIPTLTEAIQYREEKLSSQKEEELLAAGVVDLNIATLEQLCTLPGIGTSKAESIIAYREQNGAFHKIEDIMNITGIKDGMFQKIKDKIVVRNGKG